MPRIVKTTVYELKELSEAARERARAWYRESCFDHAWYEFVYEDFETVCQLLGVTLGTSPVPLMGGGTRETPHIFFAGFSNQGDGASFQGYYEYARGAARAVRAYAPRDTELHVIADALAEIQWRNFYQLTADIRQRGRYCHEYTMTIDVERASLRGQDPTADAQETITEALRDLARWLYRRLEREYAHQTSEPVVDETIAVNDWAFTADGRPFG
ncbi:MAG: antitoxin of toxin-antitoxin stability system [Acidobacteria bacterium]|nr:antitoxin of toxin-antitoxin stability system [Acidobacteriota bacterium]